VYEADTKSGTIGTVLKRFRELGTTSAAAETLLNRAADHVERARLIAPCSHRSGDWLNALTLTSVGLKMDISTVRIAVDLLLSAPIVSSHVCVCGKTVTVDGHHLH